MIRNGERNQVEELSGSGSPALGQYYRHQGQDMRVKCEVYGSMDMKERKYEGYYLTPKFERREEG